jgi:hypothetical protein
MGAIRAGSGCRLAVTIALTIESTSNSSTPSMPSKLGALALMAGGGVLATAGCREAMIASTRSSIS